MFSLTHGQSYEISEVNLKDMTKLDLYQPQQIVNHVCIPWNTLCGCNIPICVFLALAAASKGVGITEPPFINFSNRDISGLQTPTVFYQSCSYLKGAIGSAAAVTPIKYEYHIQ